MAPTGLKIITKEELKKHTEDDDQQWVCVEGRVIDVTKYRFEHPGGADILLEHAGQEDCTEAFDNVGHGDGAKMTLREYIIGILEGCEDVPEKVLFVDQTKSTRKPESKTEKQGGQEGGFNMMLIVFPVVVAFFLFVYFKQ